MYHLKIEKQTHNARSKKTPTPPELFVGNKNSLLLSQLQVNNQSKPGKSTTTAGNKTISLVRIDSAPETS
jgi:hypothetical protein